MRRPRKGFWVFLPLALWAWFAPAGVRAETYTVTGPQDWNFELASPVQFTARTYAWQYGIDSMIYLYDSSNNLIAANDDWFGLDSYISMQLLPGSYRLRTSVCCGNPDAWYGTSYVLDVNASPVQATTTTSTSSTTTSTTEPATTSTTVEELEETTTTESTSTTTIQESTTTTVVSEETVVPTPQTTSTSSSTTTTTSPPPAPPILEPLLPEPVTTTTEETVVTTTVPPTSTSTTLPVQTTTVSTVPEASTTTTLDVATTVVASLEPTEASAPETTPEPGIISFTPPIDASEEEKEEFESQVDIFSGEFDDYVPSGSTITVAQRRVIVGATVILFVVPLPVPAPVTPSTTSSASESTGRKEQD